MFAKWMNKNQLRKMMIHILLSTRISFPLGSSYFVFDPFIFLTSWFKLISIVLLMYNAINLMRIFKAFNFFAFNQLFKPSFSSQKLLYFDYQATTPVDYRVLDAMMPFSTEQYGNPHSKTHKFGWDSAKAIEKAREQIANLIGADQKEIIFTSGATEANNMVLKGLAKFYGGQRKHIITTQIEHKCILDTCRYLELEGYKVTYLPVAKNGLLDIDLLKKTIQQSTQKILCVSVIFVHNQIGVRQNIEEIGKLCKEKKIFFHTDAAQATGKIQIDVNKMNIDLMSISAHKLYGPKGIGALYLRRKPKIRLAALINGGGQQRGFRSGTLPTPLVVGFGKACEVAQAEMKNDGKHIEYLYRKMLRVIRQKMTHVELNGDETQRYYGNVNLSFAYVEGQSLLMALKNYAVSSGSACTSESLEPSYVLRAIGVSEALAHTSLRIGIGRFTSEEEIDQFLIELQQSVVRLRELSPLYEMMLEGVDMSKINWSQPH